MRINLVLCAVIAAALLAGFYWPEPADQGSYPVPKLKILVPSQPGGTTDTTARAVARSLERHTGVKALVINQTAGGGTVAVSSVAGAKADGGTLLLFHAMLHVAHATGRMQYGATDLTPLATVSRASDVFIVRTDSSYQSLEDVMVASTAKELLVASQLGGTTQLKATALAVAAARRGGKMRPVAMGSMANRLTALLGKQVDVSIVDIGTARQYADAGSVRPLAVISAQRDPFEPGWPTAVEQGVSIELEQVAELYAPAELPVEVQMQLDAVFQLVLQDPQLVRDLAQVMQAPDYRDSADTQAFVQAEEASVLRLLGSDP